MIKVTTLATRLILICFIGILHHQVIALICLLQDQVLKRRPVKTFQFALYAAEARTDCSKLL